LTLSLAAGAIIGVVWLTSAFFFAEARVCSTVGIGVRGGDFEFLYCYFPNAGDPSFDAGLNPKIMSLDLIGGSERTAELLTISIPLWVPLVVALVGASVARRRVRQQK
jgi:hypothetical protein